MSISKSKIIAYPLLMLIAICLNTSSAVAQTWKKYSDDTTGTAYYYDTESIERDNTHVTVWTKLDHSRDKTIRYRISIDRNIISCEYNTMTLTDYINYAEDGKVISSGSATEIEHIVPESTGMDLRQAICPQPAPSTPTPRANTLPTPAVPRGDLQKLITPDDYPAEASRKGEEGIVLTALTVNAYGLVETCQVVSSTASSLLNSTTCNLLQKRALFTPARDGSGKAKTDTVYAPPVRWLLHSH